MTSRSAFAQAFREVAKDLKTYSQLFLVHCRKLKSNLYESLWVFYSKRGATKHAQRDVWATTTSNVLGALRTATATLLTIFCNWILPEYVHIL